MDRKILIAPNAFKHSLSAIEVAYTIKSALDSLDLNFGCEIAPVADGGDGTIEILNFYFKKSKLIECTVHDPLMRLVKSHWLLLNKETAIIELSKASGLALLKENELNPMWANTFGTGELILSALNKGCTKIIVALGGSATIDAGVGILLALGVKIFDKKKNKLKAGGGFLNSTCEVDLKSLNARMKKIKLDVLCDVKIPLVGEKGTVQRFGAQKGAKEGEKIILEANMNHFADVVSKCVGGDYRFEPMVGAAGGVAFSLKVFLGANLFSGFSYLASLINLEDKIKNSDIVITGEGKLDLQTLMGKGVFELAKLAKKHKKMVVVLCGDYEDDIDWKGHGMDLVIKIKPKNMSIEESLKNTKDLIEKGVKENHQLFINH